MASRRNLLPTQLKLAKCMSEVNALLESKTEKADNMYNEARSNFLRLRQECDATLLKFYNTDNRSGEDTIPDLLAFQDPEPALFSVDTPKKPSFNIVTGKPDILKRINLKKKNLQSQTPYRPYAGLNTQYNPPQRTALPAQPDISPVKPVTVVPKATIQTQTDSKEFFEMKLKEESSQRKIVTIQRIWRKYNRRKKLLEVELNRLAKKIQLTWVTYKHRKMEQQRKLEESAVVLQAFFRMVLAQQTAARKKKNKQLKQVANQFYALGTYRKVYATWWNLYGLRVSWKERIYEMEKDLAKWVNSQPSTKGQLTRLHSMSLFYLHAKYLQKCLNKKVILEQEGKFGLAAEYHKWYTVN